MKSKHTVILVCLFSALVAAGAFAQQEMTDSAKAAEMAKMQEEMMRLAQPGAEHEMLAGLAGKWKAVSKIWMEPSSEEPMIMEGESHHEMILGNRFLEMKWTATGGGMTGDGLIIVGFDNRNKKFNYVAFDTWGTYYVTASGTMDDESQTLTLSGEEVDPVAGFTLVYDYVYKFVDDNTFVFEVIFKNPEMTGGEPEFRMVEVTYTRMK